MTTAPAGSGDGGDATLVRPRNAAASRRALLEAAQSLFGQKGFEQTTIREIGQEAGVDAALIARYFGSKADLYIAAVVAEGQSDQSLRAYEDFAQIAEVMLTRTDARGPGPIVQAIIRADTSDEIRAAALAHLTRRLIDPLVAGTSGPDRDQARLRTEIAVSALIGLSLGRSLGWFKRLPAVPRDELVQLITAAFGPMTGGTPSGDRPA
jgi:AcrR family transcriptional regulator